MAQNAETIFNEFRRLGDGGDSRTAEERLKDYCRDVLTAVEGFHFDYKCKQDHGKPQLDESDKRNLARALSGFANSGGGVLLWGIEEGQALTLRPIAQIETFTKKLQELSGHLTDPVVPGIDGAWLPSAHDPTAGFAAILVPESPLPPHRVLLKIKEVQYHYYMRTGSDFIIASHTQLEDMFGRRPRPSLVVMPRADDFGYDAVHSFWPILLDVVNQGRGTAKQVCIEFPYRSGMGARHFHDWRSIPGLRDATSHQSFAFELLPPRVIHPGMAIEFDGLYLQPSDFVSGADIELPCTLYCEGCAPVHTSIKGKLQPI